MTRDESVPGYVRTEQAAELLNVTNCTVRRYVKKGILKRKHGRGWPLYAIEDIQRINSVSASSASSAASDQSYLSDGI